MWSAKKSIIRIFGASGGTPRGRRRLDRNDGRTRALNPAGEHIDRRQVLLIANADILEALRVSPVSRKIPSKPLDGGPEKRAVGHRSRAGIGLESARGWR